MVGRVSPHLETAFTDLCLIGCLSAEGVAVVMESFFAASDAASDGAAENCGRLAEDDDRGDFL